MLIRAKKSTLFGVTVVSMLVGVWLGIYAGNLDPPGPPAPTMKTLAQVEPRTPIHASDLPFSITSPGSYYLAENISTAGAGITIGADNVSIDLMGFSLSDGTGDGISVSGTRKNITIRNGSVSGWSGSGILLTGTVQSRVLDINALDNSQTGILLDAESSVLRCRVYMNGGSDGIMVGAHSEVLSCYVSDSEDVGIRVGEYSKVRDCTVWGSAHTGIFAVDHSEVTDCMLGQSQAPLLLGDYCRVTGCSFTGAALLTDAEVGSNNLIADNYFLDGATITVNTVDTGNVVTRNIASTSLFYSPPPAGNDVGPLGDAATSTSPWANIE